MIQLRQAWPSDLASILSLEKQFAIQGLVGSDSEEIHRERMECPELRYFIIEHQGECAGFVVLCGVDSINRSIELKRIVVSRPGTGIGRAALRVVMRIAFHEFSAHRLWLDVYTDNERARHVYRAIGFVEEGTIRECIWNGGRFRSLVVMSILDREFENVHIMNS